jgi:hypothetical protein
LSLSSFSRARILAIGHDGGATTDLRLRRLQLRQTVRDVRLGRLERFVAAGDILFALVQREPHAVEIGAPLVHRLLEPGDLLGPIVGTLGESQQLRIPGSQGRLQRGEFLVARRQRRLAIVERLCAGIQCGLLLRLPRRRRLGFATPEAVVDRQLDQPADEDAQDQPPKAAHQARLTSPGITIGSPSS